MENGTNFIEPKLQTTHVKRVSIELPLMEKLKILSDAAKYDVACTSSGVAKKNPGHGMGNAIEAGICHSFSADGRCISLLKLSTRPTKKLIFKSSREYPH